jgi:predicted Zn-dependent protease
MSTAGDASINQYLSTPAGLPNMIKRMYFASGLLGLLLFPSCKHTIPPGSPGPDSRTQGARPQSAIIVQQAYTTALRTLSGHDPDLAFQQLRQDPRNGNVYYRLGIYYRLKDAQKAIEYFKKAIELQPGDREAVLFLASTQIVAGKKDEGAALLRELAKNPNDTWGRIAQRRLTKL